MPKILKDRVKALKRSGKDESSAWAIATATLEREGKLDPHYKSKEKGKKNGKEKKRLS